MANQSERLPKIMFFVSAAILIYGYGLASEKFGWFPAPQITEAFYSFQTLQQAAEVDDVLYADTQETTETSATVENAELSDGLILVMGVTENRENIIRVIDRDGAIVHELRPDWFEIWPQNEGSFPPRR